MRLGENLGSETTYIGEFLAFHRQVFLERLSALSYKNHTIRQYEHTIHRFCEKIEQHCISISDLNGPAMETLREAVLSETRKNARTYAMFHLGRFIEYLTDAGVIVLPKPPSKEPTALDSLREEYDAYLRKQRGLSEASIYTAMRFLERFMTFRFGETLGDLNAITPDDIVAFLCLRKPRSHRRGMTPPSRLRSLFKFLFWSGRTKLNLANSIPRVAQHNPVDLPRYLKPEEVQRLIEVVRKDDPIGHRNYAMLLLLARLGLRGPEVIAIQLDDIDWRSGEILIRGKGKLYDRMPLLADVGEAIVDYIRNGRAGGSRALFVSSAAPYRPFKKAVVLNSVLQDAFEKAGLEPPQKYVGSHVFRHSLATDMIHKGASLDEIGDVLRHRSRMTTTIYAKHDIDALRSIARPWPAGGAR